MASPLSYSVASRSYTQKDYISAIAKAINVSDEIQTREDLYNFIAQCFRNDPAAKTLFNSVYIEARRIAEEKRESAND